MKKNEMGKLALLGIAAGLLMVNQPVVEASEDDNTINLECMIAKPKCKAHGGCGGLTASRDPSGAAVQSDDELDSEDENIDDIDDKESTETPSEAQKAS